ncbi:hypothetical protein TPER_HE00197 [Candidatus Hoaglandella endobia]|uniref:Uncharacterized protein n=1 Tax=Candidatus Hoaglandella endobia TaxID=1778263 RepID=A0A143WW48_9ENTR|nr:hypothetical protein TPER_HE00197 [Candidatus Hoaglandella endobia]
MVIVAQLVEPWIVVPVVVGSSPISHPIINGYAKVAELVDALASGVSVLTDMRVQVPLFAPSYISLIRERICRRVAQLGSATGLGPVGRRFESSLADHFLT